MTCVETRKREKKRSAVVRTQAGYTLVDKRRKRTDKVTGGDYKQARIKEEVPEVSTSASNQEKSTIGKAVAFSKQPAREDPRQRTTPKTANDPKQLRKNAPAMDTGHYEVLGSRPLDYTISARQLRETGELTFQLLPKAKTVLFPKDN